jgi:hypothetical protein
MKYKSELIEELKNLYDEDYLKTDYRITIWGALEDILSYNDIKALVEYSQS